MRGQAVSVSFRSLPIVLREAIESDISRDDLILLIASGLYSFGTRRSALYYFDRKVSANVG